MKCAIQWIDSNGKPTPDDREAIGLAQCFEPRVPGKNPAVRRWDIGEIRLSEQFPICEEHAKQRGIFWALLPFPGHDRIHSHELIRQCPTPEVIQAIINSWPDYCESILKELKYNYLEDYWSFVRFGIYIGCEPDGYCHS